MMSRKPSRKKKKRKLASEMDESALAVIQLSTTLRHLMATFYVSQEDSSAHVKCWHL
jgi:hypothetical protein